MTRAAAASFAAYTATFALLGHRWVAAFGHAVPLGAPAVHPDDARYPVWILAWVTHALTTTPSVLFDAPSYHPAPEQLAGSDHFLSSQLVFAPLYLVTGNAVLAANALVFLSYPLAGFTMQRLLVALGCHPGAAWVGGLAYALGPLCRVGNIQLVQHLSFWLPAVALALVRLSDVPSWRRAGTFGAVLALALFSGYYLAVLALVSAVTWVALELVRPLARRLRFAGLAIGAALLALGPLVAFSAPYFRRASLLPTPDFAAAPPEAMWHMTLALCRWTLDPFDALLVVAALLVARSGVRDRRAVHAGLALAAVGAALFLGPLAQTLPVSRWTVGLPSMLLYVSPGRFFRAYHRFAILVSFGTAILAGAVLEHLRRRGLGWSLPVTAALVIAVRGAWLGGGSLDELQRQPLAVTEAVHATTDRLGRGPLLELPVTTREGHSTDTDSMIAATRHWLPLLLGASGYPPPHRKLLLARLNAFPDSQAVDDVVAMTDLRWILLQPRERWARPGARDTLLGVPGLLPVLEQDGWTLVHVRRGGLDPVWYGTIASAPAPDRTVLGTPLAPLDEARAKAAVVADRAVPPEVGVGSFLALDLAVRNTGDAPWPVSAPPGSSRQVVELVARWQRVSGDATPGVAHPLPRDVRPGERLAAHLLLRAPDAPGEYVLTVHPRQVGGASFATPGNAPLRVEIRVVART